MASVLEKAATVTVVLAAVVIAVANVARLTSANLPNAGGIPHAPDPELVSEEDWDAMLENAIIDGDPMAPIVIVEFGDFECPFCRRFHETFVDAREVMGDSLALAYVHYPLPSHRFSVPSARAAECAEATGSGAAMVELLFAKQDSVGLKSWGSFAEEVGIAEGEAFAACVTGETPLPRISIGRALGERIGVTHTPTIIINRWRLPVTPFASLIDVSRDILRGGDPYGLETDGAG